MSLLGLANSDNSVILSFLALAIVLAKVLEVLIKKFIKSTEKVLSEEEHAKLSRIDVNIQELHDKVDVKSALSEDQNAILNNLYDLHSKTDSDGIPLHYFPRSFIETQKEVVEVLQEISSHQEKTTFILEHLVKRIEKLEDRLSDCHIRKKEE